VANLFLQLEDDINFWIYLVMIKILHYKSSPFTLTYEANKVNNEINHRKPRRL